MLNKFRKIIFWCHLAAGAFAGIVVLVMSVTGVLLTYERQLIAWADARTYQIAPPASSARLPLETLVARARETKGAATTPTAVTFRAAADAPVAVTFGREGSVFVNPYTGEVLGEGARAARAFFRFVTDAHRWLAAPGESRTVGRSITGAANLAFLFLVASGFYLWMPRRWTWRQISQVTWFRRGLGGRARDFNWHNVIGFWCAIPLFIVVLSAVVISYTWAGNLVYRVVGETPPAPRAAPNQAPPATGQNERRGDAGKASAQELYGGLDDLHARAAAHTPGWQSIALQLPMAANAPVTFTIDEGNGGQPHLRAQLTLGRAGGEVVRYEPYSGYSRGRKLRSFLRFAHTGEVAGIVGQTVAGLASLGAVFLVWTGLALAWRRLRAWRSQRRDDALATPAVAPSPQEMN